MPSAKSMRTQQRRAETKQGKTHPEQVEELGPPATSISDDPTDEVAGMALLDAFSALDRAASRGVIHRNNASRRKSRLARNLNKARSGQA